MRGLEVVPIIHNLFILLNLLLNTCTLTPHHFFTMHKKSYVIQHDAVNYAQHKLTAEERLID